MKIYGLLFISAILLSFSAAYFTFSLQKNNFATKSEIKEINLLLNNYYEKSRPELELDFNNIYPAQLYFQLLQSNSVIKKDNLSYTKSCIETNNFISSSTDKDEIVENFRCKRIKDLPANFFVTSPSVNSEGVSYAYLAYLTLREPYASLNWIKANLNFFHVDELNKLPNEALERPFIQLAKLNKEALDGILSNQNTILSNNFFLKKSLTNNSKYYFYERTDLENFFKEKNYYLKKYNYNEDCYYHYANICFEPSNQNIFKQFRFSSIVILSLSIGILTLVSFALYIRIKQKEIEDEQKKHALRILTHELRTPITNLLLQVEILNKNTSDLPLDKQENILKIESEVYRLKRLAEKSTSYLQTHEKNKLFKLDLQKIESLDLFFEQLLETYKEFKLEYLNLVEGASTIVVDPYWLNIALKNLIENALVHGALPLKIQILKAGDFLHIQVIDAGQCKARTLSELTSGEKKEVKSYQQGLGLGLSIVEKIVSEMNGQLRYTNNPTMFEIIFKDER